MALDNIFLAAVAQPKKDPKDTKGGWSVVTTKQYVTVPVQYL